MNFLSLFSGIGGFDLGLERAGMTCVGQVEIDPYCRAVLAKHWPNVKRMEDVRQVKGDEFGPVDLIAGGVPCQPASCAGKRKGHEDERWLWGEWIRLVRAIGPAWFIAENVRGFLSLPAAGGVVRDLEGAGYEVWTVLLGAHHVGAPHRRDRIWIVGRLVNAGSSTSERNARGLLEAQAGERGPRQLNGDMPVGLEYASAGDGEWNLADAPRRGLGTDGLASGRAGHVDECGEDLAHSAICGCAGFCGCREERTAERRQSRWPSRPGEPQHEWEAPRLMPSGKSLSDVGRVSDWFTDWMDRLAVVPISHILMGYAKTTNTVHSEAVRSLRADDVPEAVFHRSSGGPRGVWSPEVLQPSLHGGRESSGETDAANTEGPGATGSTAESSVRTVRRGSPARSAPHGREPGEQQARKRQDPVRGVSHEMALEERQKGATVSAVQRLRGEVEAARTLPEALVQIQEVWRSAADQEERRSIASAVGPCVAKRIGRHRRNSLKALGNSVVPTCAEVIGRAIMEAAR